MPKNNKNNKNTKNTKNTKNPRKKVEKNGKIWQDHFQKYNDILKIRKLYLKDIEGDGNCLFRAISDQLNGNQDSHMIYRKMSIDEIISKKDYYMPFIGEEQDFDEYIKKMSKEGEWGGNLELQILSQSLNVSIIIHQIDGPPLVIKNQNSDKQINIAFHYAENISEHYSSIRQIGSNENEKAEFETIKTKIQKINIDQEPEQWGDLKSQNKKCECGSQKKYKNCCLEKNKKLQKSIQI